MKGEMEEQRDNAQSTEHRPGYGRKLQSAPSELYSPHSEHQKEATYKMPNSTSREDQPLHSAHRKSQPIFGPEGKAIHSIPAPGKLKGQSRKYGDSDSNFGCGAILFDSEHIALLLETSVFPSTP